MTEEEQQFKAWLNKQDKKYLRELAGSIYCLPGCAESLSLLEIGMALGSALELDE